MAGDNVKEQKEGLHMAGENKLHQDSEKQIRA